MQDISGVIYCPLLLHLHNESLTEKKRVEEVLFAQHLLTTEQREQFDTMCACFSSSNLTSASLFLLAGHTSPVKSLKPVSRSRSSFISQHELLNVKGFNFVGVHGCVHVLLQATLFTRPTVTQQTAP